jgi:8-oxo-dGTP pyrophosphatase MutT (NUDIX family)
MVKPWRLVSEKNKADLGLFKVKARRAVSPLNDLVHEFMVVKMPDWLQLLPLTQEGRVVLVKQYRHANQKVGLEAPGGLVEAGDPDPGLAALRELREETGYGGGELFHLGSYWPQPAMLANQAHFYMARDVILQGPQEQDPGEDIDVVLLWPEEMEEMIAAGKVHSAMTVLVWTLAQQAGLV